MKKIISLFFIAIAVLLSGCGIVQQTPNVSSQTGGIADTGSTDSLSRSIIPLGQQAESISLDLKKGWEGNIISGIVINALDASQTFNVPMAFIITNTTNNALLLTTPEFVEEDEVNRNVYSAPSFEVTCNSSRQNPVVYVPGEIGTADNRNDGQGPKAELMLSSRKPARIESGGKMTLIDGNSPHIVLDVNQTTMQGTSSITCKLRVNRFAGMKETMGIEQYTESYYRYLDLNEQNPGNAWILVDQATISLGYSAQKLSCQDTSCSRSVSFREK